MLDGVAGIVIGDMPDEAVRRHSASSRWRTSSRSSSSRSASRCIAALPIGHGKHHATVPIGAMATLDADAGTLVVEEVVTAD